ncbi:MAG TPA: PQQ-binding-like beta-propeller repeat protein [Candidatus Dormibacteraeota bacterium]|nr:PQQ-binding-like beta-propeller repeat protein [Candidatus Dormibacteraeota bacterium]
MYRGDLTRDGHPAEASLGVEAARHLKPAWQVEMSGGVSGTPAVAGGVVVAASAGGVVAAYRAGSGTRIWQVDGLGAISGSPTIDGGRVIVGSLNGHVYAIDLNGGGKLWDAKAPGVQPAIWSSPTVYGRLVLAGVGSQYGDKPLEEGGVVAFDLATGSQVWELCALVSAGAGCLAGDGIWSTPAIDAAGHGYIGVGNPDDGVLAFDAATGRRLWMTSFHSDAGRDVDLGATPIVLQAGGREVVAVGSNAGVFKVLAAATGSVVWSRDLVNGSAVHGLLASPAYDGKDFYVPSAGDPFGMFALDAASGKTLWTNQAGLPVYSAPAIGNGVLVFGTGDVFGDPNSGGLVALSSRDGTVLWSHDLHSAVFSGPAMSGDMVLVGDSRGDVIAFRPA